MADIPRIDVLTAQELAAILQVGKNTVYNLAKSGALPSYTVGRKLRFSLDDVQTYIDASTSARQRAATPTGDPGMHVPGDAGMHVPGDAGMQVPGDPGRSVTPARARRSAGRGESVASGAFIIGGRDLILDILANYLSATGVRALRSYRSSYHELADLYLGNVQAAAIHMWDGSTGSYNLPYVKRLAPGTPVVVLHLATRSQGLLVKRRDPLGLRTWSDLVHKPVVLANRERGSGSRVLLDEHLRLLEANPHAIRGYEREITSELAHGLLIARGSADVGIGTERVFHQIDGLDYRPLQMESLALVIAKTPATERIIRTVRGLLRSETFQRELVALPGCDFARMGARLYET
jgi:putative molybdopterin biosynthesis protein